MSSLRMRGIQKNFGSATVLHGIDLDVADGEFVVLVGPSGCGKSTLLRCIAGLEDIDAGELQIDGRRVNDVEPAQRGLAMVFQSYALYPHMTVAENMGFGLRMLATPKAEIDRAVTAAAQVLQIVPLLQRLPAQLSGGQRQRVAIGRAIVRRPGIFLFDEPLSNLDAALRTQMRLEMARLHAALAATVVYVTHDQAEAMTLADRIVVFNAGRIEQAGTPLELYRRPTNTFVAGFLGSPRINLLDASVLSVAPHSLTVKFAGAGDLSLALPGDAAQLQVGDAVTIGIRPEQLSAEIPPPAGRFTLEVTVQLIEHLGDVVYAHGVTPSGAALTARAPHDTELHAGSTALLSFAQADVLVFDAAGRAIWRAR